MPIVEGHGEVPAVRILLERICSEFTPGSVVHVLKPIRQPRAKLIANKNDCLQKSLTLAIAKLRQMVVPDAEDLILLLLDADDDCAAELGPRLLHMAASLRSDADIACVFAVHEYETWFVAAADSLTSYLTIQEGDGPENPEKQGCRKKWIEDRFRAAKYSETVDQPKLTAAMNLSACRSRSDSFDKLCRELLQRLGETR